MTNIKNSFLKDKILLTGLLLIILSTIIFWLPEMDTLHLNDDAYFGIFFFNYSIAVAYLVVLLIHGFLKFRWSFFQNSLEYTICLLVLYFISAFSLNRQLPIFEQSTTWLCIFLCLQCITLILLSLRSHLPDLLVYILIFFNGCGTMLYLYFATYLFPFYAVGLIAFFFFGISLLVFVPLLLLFFSIQLFRKLYKENRRLLYPYVAGIILPVIIAAAFIFEWNHSKNKINYLINESVANESRLPPWINLCQRISKNFIIEKILKADLVYSTPDNNESWGWRMPEGSFDETRKHDPLVMLGCLFAGKPDLQEKEKIKILESMYDSRHQAQERLWSGDMLETSNVISNIKIFPEYRFAYTEKILSVRNNQESRRWNNTQEAIYTFHLPEGGVVTSLSLWIAGKEEKGIMTTKSKADSAYKTIVGVERRDPSVVHWQEGNTVSVRVFPCTPEENRRFKIGVTAPLRKEGNVLIYENIYFDGPTGQKATESIQVKFSQKPLAPDFPFKITGNTSNLYKCEKHYDPYWEIKFSLPAISTEGFSFNGSNYKIANYEKSYGPFDPGAIYLDLNSAWLKEELIQLWEQIKNREVYVFNETFQRVTNENINGLYDEFSTLNFSLLPIQQIKNPDQALIISKSTPTSPNLRDLNGSDFSAEMIKYLHGNKEIRFFNLGHNLSPYLKTLKELRVFIYDQGSLNDLTGLIKERKFVLNKETSDAIVIENAQVVLNKDTGTVSGSGPDHIMRLYAYNHIMKNAGRNYFNSQNINDSLVAEAVEAYVVSPVSSLIVLETQKDYDRFGIENSKNSLKNASMKSAGAVPEPHEWMLIILTGAVMLFMIIKSKLTK